MTFHVHPVKHQRLHIVGQSKLAHHFVSLPIAAYTEQWSIPAPAEVLMLGGRTVLIFTDEQLRAAGIRSLSKKCSYCSKALSYPLIMNDDAGLMVLHAACAAALADIIVDLYSFFRPPAPYQQLFVLNLACPAPAPEGGT